MAEWLRRLTRNQMDQMGSSRVGSNPTRSDYILRMIPFDRESLLDYSWPVRLKVLVPSFIQVQQFFGILESQNDHQM